MARQSKQGLVDEERIDLGGAAPASNEARNGKGENRLTASLDGVDHFLWVEDRGARDWTAGERAALALAATVVSPRIRERTKTATDSVRLRQRLEDAAVMTGRVAHAFDNVLTGILGFAELTLGQVPPESPPHQYVGEVLRAAQQGVLFTRELHLFSRCGVTDEGPTELAAVLAEEEARLGETAGPAFLIERQLPPDLPPLAIDAEALRHVLRHLLDNARESGGRAIAVAARRIDLTAAACTELWGDAKPGPFVEFTVADRGGGLAPATRQRLFHEPFFSNKPRHRGLGLAIVCRILISRRGGFRLEPASEGGTVARVFLPAMTPPVGKD